MYAHTQPIDEAICLFARSGALLGALVHSTHSAARYLLAALPSVVRLAIEAEVRLADWKVRVFVCLFGLNLYMCVCLLYHLLYSY